MNPIVKVILRESILMICLASVFSALGGIGLNSIESKLVAVLPLLVLFPALNNLNGDLVTTISSKFTTMLYLGRVKSDNLSDLRYLFIKSLMVGVLSTVYLCVLSFIISGSFSLILFVKVFLIALLIMAVITSINFIIAVISGLIVYYGNHDPDNYLFPLTTSISDLATMLMLTLVTSLFF